MERKLQKLFIKGVYGVLVWLTVGVSTMQASTQKEKDDEGRGGFHIPSWSEFYNGLSESYKIPGVLGSLFSGKGQPGQEDDASHNPRGFGFSWFTGKVNEEQQAREEEASEEQWKRLLSHRLQMIKVQIDKEIQDLFNMLYTKLYGVFSLNKNYDCLKHEPFLITSEYMGDAMGRKTLSPSYPQNFQVFIDDMSQKLGCPVYCLEFTKGGLFSQSTVFFKEFFMPYQKSIKASFLSDQRVIQKMRAIFEGKLLIDTRGAKEFMKSRALRDNSKIVLFVVNRETGRVDLIFNRDQRNDGFWPRWR